MESSSLDSEISAALAEGGVVDITTTGRRTGRPRRIEIVLHNVGGKLYISGMPGFPRNYIANLKANPEFTLHLKRGVQADLPATARVISEDAERRDILPHIARIWRRDDLEAMVASSPLFELTLKGSGAAAG